MNPVLPLQSLTSGRRFELDYGWEFLPDPTARLQFGDLQTAVGWRQARAGLSWNSQFDDLRNYMGTAWYRIRFEVPDFTDTRHVLIRFGAVDYFCEVYLNGVPIGSHEGGYTPFSFELTSAVRAGMNELTLRVIDPPMDEQENRSLYPEMMYNEIPHGKQNWYIQNSGIWQGVRIEFYPCIYIDRLDVTPNVSGEIQVNVRLAGVGLTAEGGAAAQQTHLQLSVYESSGKEVLSISEALSPGNVISLRGGIKNPLLWGPENPSLYTLEATLTGRSNHRRRVRFGFRKFETRDGKIFLNGKPFYIRGALDQDFYPETIHTPASEDFVRNMMLKAKALGINLLRCHLKVAHPVYLDVADELGLLVWAELPSWSDCWFPSDHFAMRAAVRGQIMFGEILARDWNHPCIVVQTIMNESWGINLKEPEQRKWLQDTFEQVRKTLAPLGRAVVDNSPCEGNFHLQTDIEDFHQYYSMPDHAALWDDWLARFASRAPWTFSPFGDAHRTGNEPLLVSEFGNWGLPELPEELPWWFNSSFGEREITRSTGTLERFRTHGFDSIFENYNDLARETQQHQYASLKYEIESIRRHPSIQGYVITGMTDVHWEANGLLDMWRNPKIYEDEMRSLQQPDLLMCEFERFNFFAGETIDANILLSHYSERELSMAQLQWFTSSGDSGDLRIEKPLPTGSVQQLGKLSFRAPATSAPTCLELHIELRKQNATRLAENNYRIFIFPRASSEHGRITFHDPLNTNPNLASRLRSAGHIVEPVSPGSSGQPVLLISTRWDDVVERHAAEGGRTLLLLNAPDALPAHSTLKLAVRSGTELDGRWFSNFSWVRVKQAPFASIVFTRILGFESVNVAPEHIIQDVPASDFENVLAGITYGWLNKNAALALQLKLDHGSALLTTFKFDRYGIDPYATTLLEQFISHITSKEFEPRLIISSRPRAQQKEAV